MPWLNRIGGVSNRSLTFPSSSLKNAPGPLFISEIGSSLTRAQFKNLLSATLKKAGLDDLKYYFKVTPE